MASLMSRSLQTLVFLTAITVVKAANVGAWGPTITFPLVPAAAALLPNGELLVWSAYSDTAFSAGYSGMTQTAIFNPTSGAVTQYTITNTQHDMFCPGISVDFTGRVVVTGGDTAAKTSIYTASSNAWAVGGPMVLPRGYQSSATLSDGRVFTIGGSWSGGEGGKNGEIYSSATNAWTYLPQCLVAPMLTADAQGAFRSDNHAWLFAWKNGSVLQAGPSKAMNWYGTTAGTNGTTTAAGLRASDTDAMTGDAVLYDAVAGKIFSAGGSPSYQDSYATSNAHVITLPSTPYSLPAVTTINNMYYARAFANAVVLPDGQVIVIGGQTYAIPFSDGNSTLIPELWNPTTTKFIKMAAGPTPRNYHSVALLMPDGSVFSGGGGLCGTGCASYGGTNHLDGEFFYPPYFFHSDGVTRATRPAITATSATTLKLGASFTATTNTTVTTFSLIRMGSATHTVNTDQRRVALTPTSGSSKTYHLLLPSDPGVLLPGYWMLAALTSAGVPSVAKTILITL